MFSGSDLKFSTAKVLCYIYTYSIKKGPVKRIIPGLYLAANMLDLDP